MSDKDIKKELITIHQCLSNYFGPLHWWPGDSALEIMVGAILTQNTNWQNVSKAIERLKEAKLLEVKSLFDVDEHELSQLIQSCGYFNLKTKRLKNFIHFFYLKYGGSTERMFHQDWFSLRNELLHINGIGPETADSILLYAGEQPVFVVDAYTRRIFLRHQYILPQDNYEDIQQFFMENLSEDYQLYNELHAQIVMVGKNFCKRNNPACRTCPLLKFINLPFKLPFD